MSQEVIPCPDATWPVPKIEERRLYEVAKRALDICMVLFALIGLFPLWLLIALAIKLDSPGPVLYCEPREVGKNGRRFTLYKFRTMYVNNDNGIHRRYWETFARNGGAAAVDQRNGKRVFKLAQDPRVTYSGRILRRTGLDELPQFINVLKGDMSVVGPRPAIYYEYELYSDWHKQRLAVVPGITGLYQVTARSLVPFDEMVRIDLDYIQRRSLGLDIQIMFRTVGVMLGGKGSY